MKVALGRLGWTPAVFWAATPLEFWAAFDDWVEVNCARRPDSALTEDEMDRIEAMKRRFPDRPRVARGGAGNARNRRPAPHARS